MFEQNAILTFSYRTRMNLATRLLTTYMNEPYTFHLSKNIAEMQRCLQSDTSQFMTLINSCLQLAVEAVTCFVAWTVFISYKPFHNGFNRIFTLESV